jgi:hypothetical protein
MPDDLAVVRPLRKNEFRLVFFAKRVQKDWRDLVAVRRSLMVDAWEFLTHTPLKQTELSKKMRAELAYVSWDGKLFDRWQLKLNLTDGARIWYFVSQQTVYIEKVFTAHPNETK